MAMNPVVHFELPAEDRERMVGFYSKVFGWKAEQMGPDMGNYVVVHTQEMDGNRMPMKKGMINGGFFQKAGDNPMTHPSVVISVENIEEHMEKVKAAGGKILGEVMEIPNVGKYVMFYDSEGNLLSMMQPSMKME